LRNPIDLTVESGYEEYRIALEAALSEYDAAIVINVATPSLDSEAIARGVIEAAKTRQKPILASFMAGHIVKRAIRLMRGSNVVHLATGERCAFVLCKLSERRRLIEGISSRSLAENEGNVEKKRGGTASL
jgi:acyl-CoA synthetase (NDP forming)